jgi:Right handed beta helix region
MCKRLFVTVGGARWNSRCVSAGGQISRPTGLLFLLATGAVAAAAPKYIQGHYAVPQTPQNTGITLGGNYVTLTGGLWSPPGLPAAYGIKVSMPVTTGATGVAPSGTYNSIVNVEIAGPSPNTVSGEGYNQTTGTTVGIYGGDYNLVSGCKIHDMDCPVQYCSQNCTIEYTTIYNVSSYIQIVYGAYPHPDWCYNNQAFTDLTIRYCLIANVVSEGLFFDNFSGPAAGGTFVNLIMYGCVLFEGDTASAGCQAVEVKTQAGNFGAFYFYNNFVDWAGSLDNDGPTTGWIPSDSVVKNNLFVNTATSFDNYVGAGQPSGEPGHITTANNGYYEASKDDSPADSNPINGYSMPFVTSESYPWSYAAASAGSGPAPNADLESVPSGYDPTPYLNSFQLSSGSWAASQAASISSVTGNFGVTYNFDVDMNGNTGTNLGAFQSSNPPPSTPGTLSTVGYSTPQTPGTLSTVKQ